MSYLWVTIEKFGIVILKLLGMLFLARALKPEDFGLFGMVSIFILLGNVLIESGLSGAIIKKENAVDDDYSTVFIFNLIVSLVMLLLINFFSSNISEYFDEPVIDEIIPLLSSVYLFKALGLIQITKLTKALKFKAQTYIACSSYFISFVVGYLLAINDFGVISLVCMVVVESFSSTLMYFLTSSFRPKIKFSIDSFKEMYSFGSLLMFSSMVRTAYDNILNVVFGKNFGANNLGYYYQADKVNQIYVGTISAIINKAAFPILVKNVNDPKVNIIEMRKLTRVICSICFILFILVSSFSGEIINLLFGSEWIQSAPILSVLAFSGYGLIVETLTRIYMKSYGEAKLIFKLELLKKSIGLLVILSFLDYGLFTILYCYVFSTIVASFVNVYFCSRCTPYKLTYLIYDILFPLVLSGFYYYLLYILNSIFHNINGLVLMCLSGFILFVFHIGLSQISGFMRFKNRKIEING